MEMLQDEEQWDFGALSEHVLTSDDGDRPERPGWHDRARQQGGG